MGGSAGGSAADGSGADDRAPGRPQNETGRCGPQPTGPAWVGTPPDGPRPDGPPPADPAWAGAPPDGPTPAGDPPALADGLIGVVVPDDASTLDADRLAWLAEVEQAEARRRADRRRVRWGRLPLTDPGLSGPLVVIALTLTALLGILAVVVVTRNAPGGATTTTAAAPHALADVPPIPLPTTADDGDPAPSVEVSAGRMVGRRLPEASLRSDHGRIAITALRPAVVVLVPRTCACDGAVRTLHRQAREFGLTLWLIGPGTSEAGRRELVALDEHVDGAGLRWAQDPAGTLDRALRARGVTVVLVAADGVVDSVVRNIPASGQGIPGLELVLTLLAAPAD